MAACLALIAALLGVGAARADEPTIYLTWHAPWGYPGACDTLSAACDTTTADTLWLSFDSGRASPTFLAVSGTLLFHPAVGDSLSDWWTRDHDSMKPVFTRMDFGPQPGLGYPQPYRTNGGGGTYYYLTREGGTRLKFIYATPYSAAIAIDRKLYAAGRLIIHHPPETEPRCRQPICIEWSEADISYDVSTGRSKVTSGPSRFVSLNSPAGEVCVPYRKAAALHGFKSPQ